MRLILRKYPKFEVFKLGYTSDCFKTLVIPKLSSSINPLSTNRNSNRVLTCFDDLLKIVDSLKKLMIVDVRFKLEEYRYLTKKQFPWLKKLPIQGIEIRDFEYEEMYIELNNYPKLESLIYEDCFILKFGGVPNLRALNLGT
ncbi:hypothetical protein K502DRAFT_347482 [Neoconidiobolus thromboides FSU 785]|nr:hypothetical protein K502DRAFT_347482 [Neoconidiobolus thromboides FSU 785]